MKTLRKQRSENNNITVPGLVINFRACSKAVIPEPLSSTPGEVGTVS